MSGIPLAEFADRINEIMPIMAKAFMKRMAGDFYKIKVTLPQFFILDMLNRRGESRMTDLAEFLGVTTAAMTGVADRLVRDGYAVRAYDPKDRRIVKIKVTQKGRGLVTKTIEKRRRTIIEIFGKVSERDRADYLRVLMNIRDVLTKERGVSF